MVVTKEELISCLGTIAQSGTSKFLKALKVLTEDALVVGPTLHPKGLDASDAFGKLRFLSVTEPALLGDGGDEGRTYKLSWNHCSEWYFQILKGS
ncbi:hypothetical protein Bca52824_013668 [Brassica carinata]|uniref:Uncharacterized protein n=1 Tax=Brassica carinata TaxID=52824 RepID=A0A8X8B2P5_BRACI|nr:hypothetical protein Bca52824_013668 [Brassica carinata]